MNLSVFLRLGEIIYKGLSDLAWLFTEVTFGDLFPLYGIELPEWFTLYDTISSLTVFELLVCGSLSVSVSLLLYAFIKWVIDLLF